MSSPVAVYSRLYLYVTRLTTLGVLNRAHYLLVAPLVAIALEFLGQLVGRSGTGFAGGIIYAFIRAALLSLVLFVARAIIEQRRLTVDDVSTGLGSFFGDVLTVFFSLWIASFLLGAVSPALGAFVYLVPLLLPVFETVALSPATGFGVFGSAWHFLQRDWIAWFAGHVPLLALVGVWWVARFGFAIVLSNPSLPDWAQRLVLMLVSMVPLLLMMIAFVYRGVLFLTLDGLSPRRRADRFGTADTRA